MAKKLNPIKIEEFKLRFGGKINKRKKDHETTEKRRKMVWEMMQENLPATVMGKIIGVTRQCISSDIDFINSQNQTKAHQIKTSMKYTEMDIGNTVASFDFIYNLAVRDYNEAETGQDKERFLNTALKAKLARAKVYTDTGFWPKAGIEITQKIELAPSFEDKFGKFKVMDDPAARRRIMAFVDNVEKLTASPEEIKTVDAEIKKEIPLENKEPTPELPKELLPELSKAPDLPKTD